MDAYELVARLEDLAEGQPLGVEKADGERVCLIKHGGSIYAVSDLCTHQAFPMSAGTVLAGDACVIECSWHGARFDCASGRVREGPAAEPLPTYAVRVEDGNVYVGGKRT